MMRSHSLCASYKATAVIMHAQGISTRQCKIIPTMTSVLHEVEQFFEERLEKADRFGISDVILDCGIGFGKRFGR